jgi:uncharacterized protein (TIGR00369 family)
MSAITEPAQANLNRTRQRVHPQCLICGTEADGGLGLSFALQADGSVVAGYSCDRRYQGYDGILHGGVVSSLLDGAMTNCLFAHGIVAVTAELTVRFRHPVDIGEAFEVRARIERSQPPLHVSRAEIFQAGRLKAKATGKFMERLGSEFATDQ